MEINGPLIFENILSALGKVKVQLTTIFTLFSRTSRHVDVRIDVFVRKLLANTTAKQSQM